MKRILEVEMGITMAILFLASLGAYFFYWYSTIWFFDMPMHFIGGYFICIALMYVTGYRLHATGYKGEDKDVIKKNNHKYFYLKLILLTFIIGLLWEVYEYVVDLYFGNHLVVLIDSFSDLCFDTAGAITALFFIDKYML
ncbi:MAG: hypothetical protein ACR2IQ_02940 [Minisyncoccia bacterium]